MDTDIVSRSMTLSRQQLHTEQQETPARLDKSMLGLQKLLQLELVALLGPHQRCIQRLDLRVRFGQCAVAINVLRLQSRDVAVLAIHDVFEFAALGFRIGESDLELFGHEKQIVVLQVLLDAAVSKASDSLRVVQDAM